MSQLAEITSWIEENSTEIIEHIDTENVAVYQFLQEQFNTTNVEENHLFQFVFKSYYRLDGAGLSSAFKHAFFEILEENKGNDKLDFLPVLKRLYAFENPKAANAVQFPFVSKLIHTIDNKRAIYDNDIAKIFALPKPAQQDFDLKVEHYLNQFGTIERLYKDILLSKLIPETIAAFDEKFASYNFTENKKLDFIFSAASKLKRQNINKGLIKDIDNPGSIKVYKKAKVFKN
jgi:hypothetical protein